jgi:hypothetical protein
MNNDSGIHEATSRHDSATVPSKVTRFLWFCAGADGNLLARCPLSDWVKYQSIGGIVLATTILAFVSASYAFYTVFSPKTTTALQATLDPGTMIASTLAGAIWSLVIFNIDRFIVSSTGKGDGTEKITLSEFLGSLPRLTMAVIIGVCIAAPLEIRIIKPEIDAQLELEQNAYLTELNRHAESQVQVRKDELIDKVDKAQATLKERNDYFEKRRIEINEQRRLLELEAEGKTARGVAGRGPAWQDKKDNLDKLEVELQRDKDAYANKETLINADILSWQKSLGELAAELESQKESNLRQSRHLDGLMKRIQISHEIGGMIPWAILLLLLAVETGPIFFKMMLVKSAYDYMLENQLRVTTASLGIEVDSHVFLSERQEEIHVDTYHQAGVVLASLRKRLAPTTRDDASGGENS